MKVAALAYRRGMRLPQRRPPLVLGLLATVAAIAAVTALLYPLREVAPAVSLGVVYLVAVLFVASIWGLRLGVVASLASALAFNYFHIPPTGRLTIAEAENWVALAVFVVAAIVAGSLAEGARARALEADQRRREADLAAELARLLLGTDDVESVLGPSAQRIAQALDLPSAALTREDRDGIALTAPDGARLGTLVVPDRSRAAVGASVVPTLEALLTASRDRARLLNEVVETRALRRSEEIKTTLLRAVSHDLRTPLTAITASAEALRSPVIEPAERDELATDIATEAHRLSKIVDNLIDLSRLEAGRAEPRRSWTALDEVLDAACDGLDRDRIELRLDSDLPLLHADAAQLERAFHNLLENSLRHSDGETVQVRARVVGAKLVVRVVDRGPGVSTAEQKRIFEPFYRSASDDRRSAGSGLGLAIVRGFLEANGGSVHVESLPGQGASFVVQLPLVEGAR